jgi:hypothetical protein
MIHPSVVSHRVPLALVAGILATLTACGGTGPAGSSSAAPVTASTTPSLVPTAASATAAAATPTSWVMPNLVGTNLQSAQDAIQSLTSYGIAVTTSHDVTGAGRQQVLDRNWKVCDQSVPPGTAISTGTSIDFGAAKLTESC